MRLRMWTYDLAREQSPSYENLRELCRFSLNGGYNAFGLYTEHRFAFPSVPWAHGQGAVTPEMVRDLQAEFEQLQIVPFLNLLGHMEGFLYTEAGRKLAEERFRGMQACPSNEAVISLAESIVDDAIAIFSSEIIHIGGDETQQLDKCPRCQAREYAPPPSMDGSLRSLIAEAAQDRKAFLYGEHFGRMARKVLAAGRRPAIWGDMLLEHPHAADWLPKETLVFDWQYFSDPRRSTQRLRSLGFEVVCCPTLHTYNAVWLHLSQAETNVLEHVREAVDLDAYGVCLTTWEMALFGSYETLMPAIGSAGRMMSDPAKYVGQKDQPHLTRGLTEEKLERLTVHKHGELAGMEADSDNRSTEIARLATAIIVELLDERLDEARLEMQGDSMLLISTESADPRVLLRVPPPLEDKITNRLRLLAGLPASARRLPQTGFIEGEYLDTPFRFKLSSEPAEAGLCLTLTRVDGAVSVGAIESGIGSFLAAYGEESDACREWAQLMGVELQALGGPFAFSQIRSSLKVRLLMQGNPFLAWLHHGEELGGELGAKALGIAERALRAAPTPATRGVAGFLKCAVEFVRYAEEARQAYANELPGVAAASLAPARQVFEELERIAKAGNSRFGGSAADVERCKAARAHVETVVRRMKDYGDGSLGYLPSFEHITHPKFIPHDQAAWWLINRWAHE